MNGTVKRFTIEVVIEEGNDEFWEGLEEEGKSGVDDIVESIKVQIRSTGFYDAKITCTKYEVVPGSIFR